MRISPKRKIDQEQKQRRGNIYLLWRGGKSMSLRVRDSGDKEGTKGKGTRRSLRRTTDCAYNSLAKSFTCGGVLGVEGKELEKKGMLWKKRTWRMEKRLISRKRTSDGNPDGLREKSGEKKKKQNIGGSRAIDLSRRIWVGAKGRRGYGAEERGKPQVIRGRENSNDHNRGRSV